MTATASPTRQEMPERTTRRLAGLPLALALALVVGLAGCGDGAERTPAADERAGQPVAELPAGQAGVSEPRGQELVIPPPDHARFDAELSSAATEQLHTMGYERRTMGTQGNWEGRDPAVYVYVTDRPFDEVHAYYMESAERLGMYQDADIEEQPLATVHPDEMQRVGAEHGFPRRMIDGYRTLYPQLQGRTGRSAEFSVMEGFQLGMATGEESPPDRYRDVKIEVMHPVVNLFAGELREQTAIQYTIVTMVRTDGR